MSLPMASTEEPECTHLGEQARPAKKRDSLRAKLWGLGPPVAAFLWASCQAQGL
jgi:hypothetical protein